MKIVFTSGDMGVKLRELRHLLGYTLVEFRDRLRAGGMTHFSSLNTIKSYEYGELPIRIDWRTWLKNMEFALREDLEKRGIEIEIRG